MCATTLIGQSLLNRYRVDAYIITLGGMGTIFHVWDTQLEVLW